MTEETATDRPIAPIPMVLYCPNCGLKHVDAPSEGWDNPPHRSHLCRYEDGGCGGIWRPADVPTVGVEAIETRGQADNWSHWLTHARPAKPPLSLPVSEDGIRAMRPEKFLAEAAAIVNSFPVLAVYASCEWDELYDDGKLWLAAIVQEARARAAALSPPAVSDERSPRYGIHERADCVIDSYGGGYSFRVVPIMGQSDEEVVKIAGLVRDALNGLSRATLPQGSGQISGDAELIDWITPAITDPGRFAVRLDGESVIRWAAKAVARRLRALSSSGDDDLGQSYFIVWNAGRTEGFVTDDEDDATEASSGRQGNVTSTLGEAFFEAYGGSGPLSVQALNLTPPTPDAPKGDGR